MAQAKIKGLPRPYDRILNARLAAAKPQDQAAKLLELRVVELLIRSGAHYSEANRAAEQLAVDPKALAEMLHKIGSEYLNSFPATPVQP